MFERFNDEARMVVVVAQEQARVLKHDLIRTEHLLLSLAAQKDGVGVNVLERFGIGYKDARAEVLRTVAEGTVEPPENIPFSPDAKTVLELSLREALQLGHSHIGAEHILLALLAHGQGVGASALASLGANLDAVRSVVIELADSGPVAVRAEVREVRATMTTVHSTSAGTEPPGCPRCGASLAKYLAFALVTAAGDDETTRDVRVLYCERCGRAMGVQP